MSVSHTTPSLTFDSIVAQMAFLHESEWAQLGHCNPERVATCIVPARWALWAACATLVGVTRTTISLAVIIIELYGLWNCPETWSDSQRRTGTLSESLPIMLVTLFAKITADAFSTHSIYDLVIANNELPYLEESCELGELDPAEIADLRAPVVIVNEDHTVGSLRDLVTRFEGQVAGFPVLRRSPDGYGDRPIGYIAIQDLALGLSSLGSDPSTPCTFRQPDAAENFGLPTPTSGNVGLMMNCSPMLVTMRSPVELLQELFSKLGIRCCIVTDDQGCYMGVIEKDRWVSYVHWVGSKQTLPFGSEL
jgi:chloride channel 3/4/5